MGVMLQNKAARFYGPRFDPHQDF